MNRECSICKLECSKVPSSKSAPVLPYLKSGKCCKHVYCRECFTNWLLKAPTRCCRQETPEGKLKRLDIGCPICREPIQGLWPILMGQVQELSLIWGPDDVCYRRVGGRFYFVPPEDTRNFKVIKYTKGYFFDGPNRMVEEVTIDDEEESSDKNDNAAMNGNTGPLGDANNSLQRKDENESDLGGEVNENGVVTTEEESETRMEETGNTIDDVADMLDSNMQVERTPAATAMLRH